jgi:hypothetical protein
MYQIQRKRPSTGASRPYPRPAGDAGENADAAPPSDGSCGLPDEVARGPKVIRPADARPRQLVEARAPQPAA